MKNVICSETDHDNKTFARNLVFERENPFMSCMLYTYKYFIVLYVLYASTY